MDRKYWEKIAPAYDDEIFDVLKQDKKAIIRSVIEDLSSPSGTVADIGCAVGKWLPVLSPRFKKVLAVDISIKNLSIAQKTYPELDNIDFLRADMSSLSIKLPKSDVVVCINAILTASFKKRNVFFRNLGRFVHKNGHLVLVVPSLESWMLTHIVQHKWDIDKKLFNKKISPKGALAKYKLMLQGAMPIDDVPTKHYLKEELEILLSEEGFYHLKFQKINYSWKTEFLKPPKHLKEPMPWDWLCVAARK
jgi:ubiquinone/menaquinone biosynthesis C-methylase UbiE